MRSRRDPFARATYRPVPSRIGACAFCGTRPVKRHPLYFIQAESDSGRVHDLKGSFCSWNCAESYHGADIGR